MSVLENEVNLMSLLQNHKFWVNKCMCACCISGIFAFMCETANAIFYFFLATTEFKENKPFSTHWVFGAFTICKYVARAARLRHSNEKAPAMRWTKITRETGAQTTLRCAPGLALRSCWRLGNMKLRQQCEKQIVV